MKNKPYMLSWNSGNSTMGFWFREHAEKHAAILGLICTLWIRTAEDEWEFLCNIG